MILVDKNIKKLISENKLIVSGYKEENLKGIAYELTIDSIYNSEKNAVSSLDLKPGDITYIKTNEEISLPENITARIIERNSVMRIGLKVDGPQYISFAFKIFLIQLLRLQTVSISHKFCLNSYQKFLNKLTTNKTAHLLKTKKISSEAAVTSLNTTKLSKNSMIQKKILNL